MVRAAAWTAHERAATRAFRVIHAGGDATGAEIERALVAATSGLPVLAAHVAVDALLDADGTIAGLRLLDDRGRPGVLRAPAVLLASGGYGELFASTTNAATATGDGVALALRAGASAADLEFVQFHPTVLYAPGAAGQRPLVTEAVRGEGALLRDRAPSWPERTSSRISPPGTSWPPPSPAGCRRPAATASGSMPPGSTASPHVFPRCTRRVR